MGTRNVLALLVATLASGCENDCDTIKPLCEAAVASRIESLLDTQTVTECLAASRADDGDRCSAMLDECMTECAAAYSPRQEANLFGCWRNASGEQLCFGADHVDGASPAQPHVYAYWAQTPTANEPFDFTAEFQTVEQNDLLVFYGYMGMQGYGCARVRMRDDALFLTAISIAPSESCADAPGDLSTFVSRFDRVP